MRRGDHLSHGLPRLATRGPRIVRALDGSVVLPRGVNRSGLEYSVPDARGFLGPVRLDEGEVERMCAWDTRRGPGAAFVVRLPFTQEVALRGRDGHAAERYLADIDQVIAWASARGAYTLLDLQWLNDRDWYQPGTRVPCLPDLETATLWETLARRYRDEPAVLFDLFNEPHDWSPGDPGPPLGVDAEGRTYPVERVTVDVWHAWARLLCEVIRAESPESLIVVSGVGWGATLGRRALADAAGATIPNVVHAAHLYPHHAPIAEWGARFGDLARVAPVFVAEWGTRERGEDDPADLAWARQLAEYLRAREIGWTAWSWYDSPRLVRDAPNGDHEPTAWGVLVRRALNEE